MMWRDGVVEQLHSTWGGCAMVWVRIEAAPANARVYLPGEKVKALLYTDLFGQAQIGERVRIEVSALARSLGTGGHAMVGARLDQLNDDVEPAGHLVKARYMPNQKLVTSVDEPGTAHHQLLNTELDLAGGAVVVADLHSALPAIIAGARCPLVDEDPSQSPLPKIAYVMSDGAALPLPYSRSVFGLKQAGWLVGSVATGQSWGGDLEAVSLHNGLLAARHVLGADIIVLTQGPGNLGSDTPWGFSGVACADALNAAAVLAGEPIAALRVSQADARVRHLGISHHSLTAYSRATLCSALIAVPELDGEFGELVKSQARQLALPRQLGQPHRLVSVSCQGLDEALATSPVKLSTMGRGLDQDRASFITAAAAGRAARAHWLKTLES